MSRIPGLLAGSIAILLVSAALADSPTPVAVQPKKPPMVDAQIISVEGSASVAETLVFYFMPARLDTREIKVSVSADESSPAFARSLAAALTKVAGPDYSVSVGAESTITISRGPKGSPFRVSLATPPPAGLTVTIR
jgi:hypothetical protein